MQNTNLREIPVIVSKEVEDRISEIQSKLVKTIEAEKELMEFEILYSLLVKPQKNVHELIKKERAKAWKIALRRTKGDREKAIETFDEIYLK